MKGMTLANITAACGGRYIGDPALREVCVTAVSTDSRKIEPGCLFLAIPGSRVDGHDFIGEVFDKGAAAVVCEREAKDAAGPCIQVESSLAAIKDIAEFYRARLDIPVVGITGSVGKTSTKEMIASVLSKRFSVLATEGNLNNELGLPQTILRLREEHEIAVLEMGISGFGEMHRLAKVARPDICVITNIGAAHLEQLGDRDGILRAKTEMFDFLKEDGRIVLNGDDDKLAGITEAKGIRPLFFGTGENCDVRATDICPNGITGTDCHIRAGQTEFDAHVPAPGEHMVMNALAGAAVGVLCGLTAEEIRAGIADYAPIRGRFRVVNTEKYTVIDDCYNANPVSMKASIEVLSRADGRKVAVLGDMGELGENEQELHAEVGRFAAGLGLDVLLAAGPLSAKLVEEAKKDPALLAAHFETRDALRASLSDYLQPGDTVLVKASHFMRFEEIVDFLAAEPG